MSSKTDYCVRCDTVWASPGKCRCQPVELTIVQEAMIPQWQYDKEARTLRHIETWNAAIEAAALDVPKYEDDNMNDIRESIRKLKK